MYKRSIPATCFGHTCGYPQGNALKGWMYREVTEVCVTNAQVLNTDFFLYLVLVHRLL